MKRILNGKWEFQWILVWESEGEKASQPAHSIQPNQSRAVRSQHRCFLAVLMLVCRLMWTSHIYVLTHELWQFVVVASASPLFSFVVSLLCRNNSKCFFSPFPLSRSLASSLPVSTPFEIIPPQSTVPCSAVYVKPDASQISSWAPCTHFLDKPLPQQPATRSRLNPLQVSEMDLTSQDCLDVSIGGRCWSSQIQLYISAFRLKHI